jgi:hypothetical protein
MGCTFAVEIGAGFWFNYLQMKKLIFLIVVTAVAGCSSGYYPVPENIRTTNKIVSIKDYNYVSYLTTVDLVSHDTTYVLSLKEHYYQKYYDLQKPKLNKDTLSITENDTVNFLLSEAWFSAGTMEQLGVRIIVGNDTLWKGPKPVVNKFFYSDNSIGLKVK